MSCESPVVPARAPVPAAGGEATLPDAPAGDRWVPAILGAMLAFEAFLLLASLLWL